MVAVEKFIDRFAGKILCESAGVLKRKQTFNNPKNLLFVKLWAVGESILVLPLIEQSKRAFPDCKISVLCRKRNVAAFTDLSFIDELLVLEDINVFKYFKAFDLVFDCEPYLNISSILSRTMGRFVVGFSHGSRAKLYDMKVAYNDDQHVALTYLDLLKEFHEVQVPKDLVRLGFKEEDLSFAKDFLKNRGLLDKKLVGVCAGVAESSASRMWPSSNFSELADVLVEKGFTVLFTGTKDQRELNNGIISQTKNKNSILNIAGDTSLKQLFALMGFFDLFVSVDTGPMHIAAAQGVPTVGLFCPNTPVRFGPYGSKNSFVYKPVLEKPCINVHLGEVPDCEAHNHMSKISVDDVLEKMKLPIAAELRGITLKRMES